MPLDLQKDVLGRWSPAKAPGRNVKAVRREAIRLRTAALRVFTAQTKWLEKNWPLMLPPKERPEVSKAISDANPTTWVGWNEPMAKELRPPIHQSVFNGGKAGMAQVGITVDWTLQNPRALKYVTKHGLDLAKGINKTTTNQLRTVIRAGLKEGLPTSDIAKNVQSRMKGMSKRRATLIAQTETIKAQAQGTLMIGKEIGADKMVKRWLDLRVNHDQTCADLHNLTIRLDEVFPGGFDAPPAHPNCVIGNTSIQSNEIFGATRMWYEGPVLRIQTAEGRDLTVSPNHPVLTTGGFRPANLINEGDDVICRSGVDGEVPTFIEQNEQLMPSRAAQIFESLWETVGVTTVSVPASAEQFHRDGKFGKGNVDVVNIDSVLRADAVPAGFEDFDNEPLLVGDPLAHSLDSVRPPDAFRDGGLSPAGDNMRSGSHGTAVVEARPLISELIGLTLGTTHTSLS